MVVSETHSQAANCWVIGGLGFPPARVLLAAWGFNSILTTPSLSSPSPLQNSFLSPHFPPSPFPLQFLSLPFSLSLLSLSLSPTHTEWIQQSGLHLLTARQLWNWYSGKFKFYTEVHPSLVPKTFPQGETWYLLCTRSCPAFRCSTEKQERAWYLFSYDWRQGW